jgi:serine phosphatase RsbU (regulator of sigma subunit)
MAVLQVVRGLNPGQVFALDAECTILGRHPQCDVVVELGAVSRQHARIVRVDDDFYVEDLNSRNKTYLNGKVLEERTKLAENDRLTICDVEFAFYLEVPETAALVQPPEETMDGPLLVDDEKITSSSTIMSKVDVSTGSSSLRLTVNAEAKLKALLEIGHALSGAVALGEVLPKVLDSLFSVFAQADRGFIALVDPRSGRLVPKAIQCRQEDSDQAIRISRTIVNGVMAGREAVLSADAATDSRFEKAESVVDFQIHSMMCAPLVGSSDRVLGVIQIDTMDQRQRFNPDDLEVLAAVAGQAAVAVENAQLHEIALEEAALRRELAVAHRVQQGFLPPAPPKLEAYEFFDFYEPAKELGGDYFDYIFLPGGRLAIVLADVSGKGISAALLMAKLSTEARYSLVREPTAAAAVCRLNEVFCESRWEDRFVTLVVAVLDPVRHEVCVVNAGHPSPLMRRVSGAVEPVGDSVRGLPLSIGRGFEYEQVSLPVAPGDSLVLYTDGICEAMNAARELYHARRLEAQLASPVEGVKALGKRILDDVRRFVGPQPQSDDMCVTCFGRLG